MLRLKLLSLRLRGEPLSLLDKALDISVLGVLGVLGGGELAGDICAGLSLGLNNWWGPLSWYSADCWVLSLMHAG